MKRNQLHRTGTWVYKLIFRECLLILLKFWPKRQTTSAEAETLRVRKAMSRTWGLRGAELRSDPGQLTFLVFVIRGVAESAEESHDSPSWNSHSKVAEKIVRRRFTKE